MLTRPAICVMFQSSRVRPSSGRNDLFHSASSSSTSVWLWVPSSHMRMSQRRYLTVLGGIWAFSRPGNNNVCWLFPAYLGGFLFGFCTRLALHPCVRHVDAHPQPAPRSHGDRETMGDCTQQHWANANTMYRPCATHTNTHMLFECRPILSNHLKHRLQAQTSPPPQSHSLVEHTREQAALTLQPTNELSPVRSAHRNSSVRKGFEFEARFPAKKSGRTAASCTPTAHPPDTHTHKQPTVRGHMYTGCLCVLTVGLEFGAGIALNGPALPLQRRGMPTRGTTEQLRPPAARLGSPAPAPAPHA